VCCAWVELSAGRQRATGSDDVAELTCPAALQQRSLSESQTALSKQENEMAYLQRQARLAEDVALHDLETLQTVEELRHKVWMVLWLCGG